MKPLLSSLFAISVVLAGTPAVISSDAESLTEALTKGKASLDVRYRLENVDQDGLALDATASTLRGKLKYTTGKFKGFSGVVEFDSILSIGKENYNNTINGKINRPVIADPEGTELNQAYLQYSGDGITLKAGRQGINLANQRFVGTVGFRQNDQTYDSVVGVWSPSDKVTAIYGYIWNVNRIFSNKHPLGNLDTNTHALTVMYKASDLVKISGYALAIDLNDAPAFGLSSATYGVRIEGAKKMGGGKIAYELDFATQSDYKDNPVDYKANYFHGSVSGSSGGFTGKLGYEVLGAGNGVSFKTPLATLHKFNGFADKFLGTPKWGLEDAYASLTYVVPKSAGPLGGIKLMAVYHDFQSASADFDYGSEFDWLVAKTFNKTYSVSLKAAHYNADSFSTDTTKIWLTLGMKF